MKNKLLCLMACILGSFMVGYFAKDLNESYGAILFAIGVILMVGSIINFSK